MRPTNYSDFDHNHENHNLTLFGMTNTPLANHGKHHVLCRRCLQILHVSTCAGSPVQSNSLAGAAAFDKTQYFTMKRTHDMNYITPCTLDMNCTTPSTSSLDTFFIAGMLAKSALSVFVVMLTMGWMERLSVGFSCSP